MEIEISGYKVLVDDEDYERISRYKWSVNKKSKNDIYFRTHQYVNGNRVTISLHRYIMGCKYRDGNRVDHIDHNTFDNRKCNMRLCTEQENNQNRRKPVTNTTGYKGVRVSTGDNRWGAVVAINDKNVRVGTYSSPEEAARMYDMLALKLHGEFACTNFPRERYTVEDIENAYTEAMKVCSCNNKSGYRGVCRHTQNPTWVAKICVNRKTMHLGSFSTGILAAIAYDKKALELLGDKAKLNFPKENYIKEQQND